MYIRTANFQTVFDSDFPEIDEFSHREAGAILRAKYGRGVCNDEITKFMMKVIKI